MAIRAMHINVMVVWKLCSHIIPEMLLVCFISMKRDVVRYNRRASKVVKNCLTIEVHDSGLESLILFRSSGKVVIETPISDGAWCLRPIFQYPVQELEAENSVVNLLPT